MPYAITITSLLLLAVAAVGDPPSPSARSVDVGAGQSVVVTASRVAASALGPFADRLGPGTKPPVLAMRMELHGGDGPVTLGAILVPVLELEERDFEVLAVSAESDEVVAAVLAGRHIHLWRVALGWGRGSGHCMVSPDARRAIAVRPGPGQGDVSLTRGADRLWAVRVRVGQDTITHRQTTPEAWRFEQTGPPIPWLGQ